MTTTPTGRANALKHELLIEARHPCPLPAEDVYDVLADLRSHLDWAGERQSQTSRLTTMDAPAGPAMVGAEFRTTGLDPMGTFDDSSVVTEATRPHVLEFVTEARLTTKKGTTVDWTNVHRYELEPAPSGCTIHASIRIVRISELPGMLAVFRIPLLSALALKMSRSVVERGLRNLAQVTQERATAR